MHRYIKGRAVDPTELLQARERRGGRLEELAGTFPDHTLISFTMNIPGPVKNSPALSLVFREGLKAIAACLEDLTLLDEASPLTGPEAIFLTPAPAAEVKKAMVALEERSPLARLYDIDVQGGGKAFSREALGLAPRSCLLCSRPARFCSRAGTHTLEELLSAIEELIAGHPGMDQQL